MKCYLKQSMQSLLLKIPRLVLWLMLVGMGCFNLSLAEGSNSPLAEGSPSLAEGSPSLAEGSPSRADGSPSRADGSNETRFDHVLSYSNTSLNWRLRKNKRDIQIYTSKPPNSKYVSVLTVMTVDATPSALAALVMDLEYCSKWAAMCKVAKTLEQISPHESIVYSLNNAPFPVRDRDVVANVRWQKDEKTGKISMFSHAIDSDFKSKKGIVRVQDAVSEWHFTPIDNGQVLVENFAFIDPNGAVPAWLMNILIIDSPYKSFKKMRAIVESGKYDNVDLSFVFKSHQSNLLNPNLGLKPN